MRRARVMASVIVAAIAVAAVLTSCWWIPSDLVGPGPGGDSGSGILALEATIQSTKGWFDSEEPIAIRCVFENLSEQTLTFLQWLTPFEGFRSDMFDFRLEGDLQVPYRGILVKRGLPTYPEGVQEYMTLEPHEVREVIVDLAAAYEATAPGTYSLQLRTCILDFGFDLPPEALLEMDAPPIACIESNTIEFYLDDGRQFTSPEAAPRNFSGCTASQRATIAAALWAAQDIALDALGMLNSTPKGVRGYADRYTEWFGTYTSSRYDDVVQHFEEISDALINDIEELEFECHDCPKCKPNYFAYIYKGGDVRIYLCNQFWKAPKLGTDSQAGTIIHEVSHEVSDTEDHEYRQSDCRKLASSDPDRAVENADSHEYFAENTPALMMSEWSGWCDCAWHEIGYDKSHFTSLGDWCPEGTYIVQLDLDNADAEYGPANSPIVGRVKCCRPCDGPTYWGAHWWVPIGYDKTHFDWAGEWCPAGSFLMQLDLDGYGELGGGNGPIVGQACCGCVPMQSWGESYWFAVGLSESHQDRRAWCPAGSFITQLDYDGGSGMEAPFVRSCQCTRPH